MKQQSSAFYRMIATSSANEKRLILICLMVLVTVVILGVFQDYLESKRNDHSFFFSESLLFKSFWLIFPPILLLIKYLDQTRKIDTYTRMAVTFMVAAMAHVVITSLTVWCLSVIFREQSYGVIKVLTYTLSNDLVKILLVYGAFIYGLKYMTQKNHRKATGGGQPEVKDSMSHLVVSTGKNNTLINFSDILFIRSATPYVSIQVDELEYLQSTTLKSIANKLDSRFIRVHRSCIVNIEKVSSFQSRLNGDYDLTLINGDDIRLSRNYVKDFRKHFVQPTQLKT